MERTIKNTAVLEICSSSVKFAVGYSEGRVPHVLYYKKFPLSGFVKDGQIPNPIALGEAIAPNLNIEDEDLKLKVDPTTINFVVPPIGFQVFQNDKTTNVVRDTIEQLDISNVTLMLKRDEVPNGSYLVDIVPDAFVTDKGKTFGNPPIGERAEYLTLFAKIFTLPEQIYSSYVQAAQSAGLRVLRSSVATQCAAMMVASEGGYPSTYFYLDLGAHLTTVSLIGNNSPYASLFFPLGGDDLTNKIAQAFEIPLEDAEMLKKKFGYDERTFAYPTPIYKKDIDGVKKTISQNQLNTVITEFFTSYNAYIKNAINTLIDNQAKAQNMADKTPFASLPLVVSGGTSLLKGLEKLLDDLDGRKLHKFSPKTLGARDPGATNILGLIVASGEYRGTLEDNYHGISSLTRGSKKED